MDYACDCRQSFIGHQGDAHIRFDGAERVVLSLDLTACERVEQRRLADVGETYDGAADTHENLSEEEL